MKKIFELIGKILFDALIVMIIVVFIERIGLIDTENFWQFSLILLLAFIIIDRIHDAYDNSIYRKRIKK